MMTPTTEIDALDFNESRKRGYLLLCVFLFPIIFSSILFYLVISISGINTKIIGHKTKFAHIETPINRSNVNEIFEIIGSLETPLPDHSYYLVEYRNKFYWPKFDLGNKTTRWNKKLTHRAKKGQFSNYQVIMADAELKTNFDGWFQKANETGKYPGIDNLTPNNIVANIKVKTQ